MNILNFSHPLTAVQLADITAAVTTEAPTVINISVQFEATEPYELQLIALLEQSGISNQAFQTEEWVVVLPAFNAIAAVLLAELHGRMGHFPVIARLRPVTTAATITYTFAELINLEQIRQSARTRR